MKKNLLFILALVVAGFTQAQVSVDWSVEEILIPTELQTTTTGTAWPNTFVLKNNGPDSVLATDTMFYNLFVTQTNNVAIVGYPVANNANVYIGVPVGKKLLSGDTVHVIRNLTTTVQTTRSINVNIRVASFVRNGSRGLAAESVNGNNIKINQIVWKMIGGYGVSVSDINGNAVKVYPTATKDVINIDLAIVNPNNNVNVSVYDLQGKLIQNKELDSSKGSIDLSNLTAGLYILKVKNGTEVYSGKIIKE